MRYKKKYELTTLIMLASTISVISYTQMQEQPTKRRTLNEEINIIKSFINEPKINTLEIKNNNFKPTTVKEIKKKIFYKK